MNWVPARQASQSRLGVIVSRKVGPAVTRTRTRRLLREAFRLHQHELNQPVDLVLIARPSIAGMNRPLVERDYLTALQRAGLRRQAASRS
jgi:ribonuclease P protein component